MMFLFSLLLFFQNAEIPFKAKEDYSVKINFEFKAQPGNGGSGSSQNIRFTEGAAAPEKKYPGGQHPFIVLNLKLSTLSSEETRIKITDTEGNSIYNKKAKEGVVIALDLGFVDEIKERTTTTVFNCILMNDKKKKTSRIYILIDKDGTYFVNETKMGKF